MLRDVAISGDRNVIKKQAEKILKYKDLTIEIQRMWNVKTNVIPVIKKVYSFCLMVEASDHGYVLHTKRIHVTRYRIRYDMIYDMI
jgi:hypothetical protein